MKKILFKILSILFVLFISTQFVNAQSLNVIAYADSLTSDTICAGDTVVLYGNVSGGSGNYTYQWTSFPNGFSSAQLSLSVVPDTTTIYTLTVSDGNEIVSSSVTVLYVPNPILNVIEEKTICQGSSITLTATSVGGLVYLWGVPEDDSIYTANSVTVSPDSTTTYGYAALNVFGCFDTNAVVVNVHHLGADFSGGSNLCYGDSMQITATLRGTAPWSLSYSDGSPAETINNINSSNYSFYVKPYNTSTYNVVSITDSLGCSVSGGTTTTINVLSLPTGRLQGVQTICSNTSASLDLSLTGVSPWNVTYTDGNSTFNQTNILNANSILTANPSQNTVYSLVSVSDANCSAQSLSGTSSVFVNTAPQASISGTNQVCYGSSSICQIDLTGNGPWDITIFDGSSSENILGISESPYEYEVTPLVTSTYTISSVTGINNCNSVGTGSAVLTVNNLPIVNAGNDINFPTGGSGTFNATVTGGSGSYNYSWSPSSQLFISNIEDPTTKNLTVSTEFTLNVVDAVTGCAGISDNVSAIVTGGILSGTITSDTTICKGQSVELIANGTGSTGNFSYSWSPATGLSNSAIYNPIATPTSTQTYTVTITDDLLNSVQKQVVITVNELPTASISGSGTICKGQSQDLNVSLTGTSPFEIGYLSGATLKAVNSINSSPYTLTVNPIATTTYKIAIVIDANGCENIGTGTSIVTVKKLPTANISADEIICNGQNTTAQIDFTGVQPWSFSYSDGNSTNSLTGITSNPYTLDLNPSSTSTVVLTAISDNNCAGTTLTGQANIVVNQVPTALLTGDTSVCEGGVATSSISLTGSKPWNITYTDGNLNYNVTGIKTNTYSLNYSPNQAVTLSMISVSDINNCSSTGTGSADLTLKSYPSFSIAGGQSICRNDSAEYNLTLTGESPWKIDYILKNDTSYTDGILSSPYILKISSDSSTVFNVISLSDKYCKLDTSLSLQMSVYQLPNIDLGPDTIVCSGAELDLKVSGAQSYVWSNNDSVSYTTVQVLSDTLFYVTGTDRRNCFKTDTLVVIVNELPIVTLDSLDTYCINDAAFLLEGGLPSGGSFIGTGIDSNYFNPSDAGPFNHLITYSYTDSNNCTNYASRHLIVELCEGIEEYSQINKLFVYPNPVSDILYLNIPLGFNEGKIQVYDAFGKQIYESSIQNNNEYSDIINVRNWSFGVYYIKYFNSEYQIINKIIKQ